VVQQEVLLVEQRKQIGVRAGEHIDRLERDVAKVVEARQIDQPHQHPEVNRPGNGVDVRRGDTDLVGNHIDQL